MAVGMATSEGLPRCPEDCGGPLGGQHPHLLTQGQKDLRERWGCDCAAAEPLYTITCPRCDGSRITPDGELCDQCETHGRQRGQKEISRCPTSHITKDISDAVRSYPHAEAGGFPEDGGLMNQSPSYLNFVSTLSGESNRIRKEEADEAKSAQKAKSRAAQVRKR